MAKHNRMRVIGILIAASLLFSGCGGTYSKNFSTYSKSFIEFLDSDEGKEVIKYVKLGGCGVVSYEKYYNPSKSNEENLQAILPHVLPCR